MAPDQQTPSVLIQRSGSDWHAWLAKAAPLVPDLQRAFQFLEVCCPIMDQAHGMSTPEALKRLRPAVNKFLGQARCPSAASCEKVAIRTLIFNGWVQSELARDQPVQLLLELSAHALRKLLVMCEGADDRHGVLLRAVRTMARDWLNDASRLVDNPIERAHLIFPLSMQDQIGLIEASWWWRQLAQCDRATVLGLIENEINQMTAMQPTSNVTWRSFDKRWARLRVQALLECLDDKFLLAELLRKSAVDDFEAVNAIRALSAAGRSREAIAQAEQWMRVVPKSSVLAEVLFDLYALDGWDEEALALAQTQFELDPNPRWLGKLAQLHTEQAQAQIRAWEKK
jgi:hypothetical protein